MLIEGSLGKKDYADGRSFGNSLAYVFFSYSVGSQ
jgi:hypothetical protein